MSPRWPARRSKYGNKRTPRRIDGKQVMFDSKREAARWDELVVLQRAGLIDRLERQVRYELVPKQDGERAVVYVADFRYIEDGVEIVEDSKGFRTPEYRIKRALMLERHGVRIRET